MSMKEFSTPGMDIKYMDILTGESLSSMQVVRMHQIFWPVRSSNISGSERGKWGESLF